MWTAIAIIGSLLGLWLVMRQCRRLPDIPTQLLLTLLWLRYSLQAFPDYTVTKGFGGLSIIALVSIVIATILISVAPKRLFVLKQIFPIYIFIYIVIVSSVLSNSMPGLVRDLVKWSYMISIIVLIYRSTKIFGFERTMRALAWTTVTPLFLQMAGFALGEKSIGPDGSINYIGGYFHEGLFSYIAMTFVCLALFSRLQGRASELALIGFGFVSLILANYRSSVIAAIPLLLVVAWSFVTKTWGAAGRLTVASVILIGVVICLPLAPSFVPERYEDVLTMAENPEVLSKSVEDLSDTERRIFSGRILLWTEYLQAVREAPSVKQMIGHGAHAYKGRMRLFAHNTFISYLFEFGVIGLVMIIYIFLSNFLLAFSVGDPDLKRRLVAAHIAFFILNLTVMPLWSTEGSTLYAIILAASWAALGQHSAPISSQRRVA